VIDVDISRVDFDLLLIGRAARGGHKVDSKSVRARLEDDEGFEEGIGNGPVGWREVVLMVTDGEVAVQRLRTRTVSHLAKDQ